LTSGSPRIPLHEHAGGETTTTFRRIGLPLSYPDRYALSIYAYNLEASTLYATANGQMFNPATRQHAKGNISQELRKCRLSNYSMLPPRHRPLIYSGQASCDVNFVYLSPAYDDPGRHFPLGCTLMWYEFKSASTDGSVMARPHFCGVEVCS